jgi:CBS domain-containing protein
MPARSYTAADLMTAQPITIRPDAPVSEALGLMRARGIHELPVLNGRRLVGLLTFESIARRSTLPLSTKAEHLLLLPPLIRPTAAFSEIAEQLLAAGLRGAPVVGSRGELLGIVSRTDLVRVLPEILSGSHQPVESIARSVGATIRDSSPVRALLARVRLLEDHPLPVVDRNGVLVGAVGIVDLGRVLLRPNKGGKRDRPRNGSVGDVEVRTLMRSPAVTVREATPVAEAAALMTREQVSSVFVTGASGEPLSIVTQTDLLGLMVAGRGPGGRSLGDVYVEITGLRGASDPSILTEIDRAVAKGLRRISRYAQPLLLNLHFAPHATHRGGDVSIEARLHTNHGIFYASNSGWNFLIGTTDLMDELTAQARRRHESTRRPRRGGGRRSKGEAVDDIPADPDLEDRIRQATATDQG